MIKSRQKAFVGDAAVAKVMATHKNPLYRDPAYPENVAGLIATRRWGCTPNRTTWLRDDDRAGWHVYGY